MDPNERPWRVWWDEDSQIARVDWAPGAVAGLAEAKEVMEALAALGHGRVPLLFDMRTMTKLEREARQHFANEAGIMSVIAMWVGSPVSKMLANFFIGVQRVETPIRLFTDDEAAIAWLVDHA